MRLLRNGQGLLSPHVLEPEVLFRVHTRAWCQYSETVKALAVLTVRTSVVEQRLEGRGVHQLIHLHLRKGALVQAIVTIRCPSNDRRACRLPPLVETLHCARHPQLKAFHRHVVSWLFLRDVQCLQRTASDITNGAGQSLCTGEKCVESTRRIIDHRKWATPPWSFHCLRRATSLGNLDEVSPNVEDLVRAGEEVDHLGSLHLLRWSVLGDVVLLLLGCPATVEPFGLCELILVHEHWTPSLVNLGNDFCLLLARKEWPYRTQELDTLVRLRHRLLHQTQLALQQVLHGLVTSLLDGLALLSRELVLLAGPLGVCNPGIVPCQVILSAQHLIQSIHLRVIEARLHRTNHPLHHSVSKELAQSHVCALQGLEGAHNGIEHAARDAKAMGCLQQFTIEAGHVGHLLSQHRRQSIEEPGIHAHNDFHEFDLQVKLQGCKLAGGWPPQSNNSVQHLGSFC
mmetsp:Transcript_45623/g.108598  ORF Transcript_45623/g.108598 Transcript_45623/m.108598 type:complete len:456 (-) Transcript_45623:1372-2739(-)